MAVDFDKKELSVLIPLLVYFVFLGLLFYYANVGQWAWNILVVSALGWFIIEARGNSKKLGNAMKVGAFLLIFDFIIENLGWISGLWHTISAWHVGTVPLQVMGIAFFGGTAWAIHMPKKFNMKTVALNCLVFGFFGALGEWLLIKQGLFVYTLWWTSIWAFVAYFLTWVILIFVRYRIFKE